MGQVTLEKTKFMTTDKEFVFSTASWEQLNT